MITWVLLLSIQCLDGHTQTDNAKVNSANAVEMILNNLDKSNVISVAGHKKCYVSYAEWFTEETTDQTTEETERE